MGDLRGGGGSYLQGMHGGMPGGDARVIPGGCLKSI
jgi:hypothetical protein